jgi:GDPmannose 4,6-dehydratase
MNKKVALITGITGQDGSYLAELLIKKKYIVHGLLRRASIIKTDRINHLFNDKKIINKKLFLHYGDMTDDLSIYDIINKVKPAEIYNLAAQSHVKVSFEIPLYTSNADALGTLRVLEAVRGLGLKCKIYQASTSELYGDSKQKIMNEKTQFQPVSPYAVSKLYSYEMIKVYRNAYNLFACNGILFNHESPRRGETFVTRKITIGLKNFLKNGSSFQLGNLDSYRDWGHAKDYVEGMWLMLQQKNPIDLVLATGKTYKVRDFLEICMKKLRINFKKKVLSSKETYYDVNSKKIICETNKRLLRPNEVPYLKGDSSKARKILGWKPKINLKQLASEMLEEEFKN